MLKRKYFGDTYHGGIMYMHLWGEFGYHQPFCWDWSKSVPRWFEEHIFRRIDCIKGYKVNLEIDGSTFEYLQDKNPGLLSKIRRYIKKGSIEIVDGTYAQPYGFLISGESCIRQFYYGKKAVKDTLGFDVRTYHKQETLFFPQIPQILMKFGYKYAVLRVHITHYGESPFIDKERLLWVSPDGSMIDTVPNYIESVYPYSLNVKNLSKYEKKCGKLGFKSILYTTGLDIAHDMDYLPTFKSDFEKRLLPNEVKLFKGAWIKLGISDDKIRYIQDRGYKFTLLSQYFEKENPSMDKIELESDDFVFKYNWGQFGDLMLRRNKEAENKIYDAEVFASFVKMVDGLDIMNPDLQKEMWKYLLLSQNHDFHACPTAYSYGVAESPINTSLRFTEISKRVAQEIIDESLDYIIANIDTLNMKKYNKKAIALVVFNQLSWERKCVVETKVVLEKTFGKALCISDGYKNISVDVRDIERYEDRSIYRAMIMFIAELPPLGYRVYYLMPTEDIVENESGDCLEDKALRIKLGKDGLIESIYDKQSHFEYLDIHHYKGNELTVDFGNGLIRTKGQKSEIKLINGKVLSTSIVNGKIGDLRYKTTYRLHHGQSRIDCETTIDFDNGLSTKSMKDNFSKFRVTFNPSFNGALFTDSPFSVYPSSKEVVSGYNFGCFTDGKYGITIVNNGNIGYFQNRNKQTKMSLVLAFGDKSYFYGALLLSGMHTFRYSIFPHDGDWKKGRSIRKSLEVYHPPYVRQRCLHNGTLPISKSFVTMSEDNVILSACYPSESGICMRIWETDKKMSVIQIKFNFKPREITETDLMRKIITRCKNSYVKLSPWEFKTFHLGYIKSHKIIEKKD